MKKTKHTELEKKYKRFEKSATFIAYSLYAVAIVFGILFVFVKSYDLKTLFGFFTSISIFVLIIIASKIAKKRGKYLQLLKEERNSIIRSGLFKEIYYAYRHDGFEFNLTCDRFLFDEYHNDAIDVSLLKNGHEFLIEIDANQISIIVDEETDSPTETEIMVSEIATIEQLYSVINDFINTHS